MKINELPAGTKLSIVCPHCGQPIIVHGQQPAPEQYKARGMVDKIYTECRNECCDMYKQTAYTECNLQDIAAAISAIAYKIEVKS